MIPTLSRRALGRATLARQLLLERSTLPVLDAVSHLVGLQAQTPHTWYVGLWSRLAAFAAPLASDLLADGSVVRIAAQRSTLHLLPAHDAGGVRGVVQPALTRDLYNNTLHGATARAMDAPAVLAAARDLLASGAMSNRALGEELHDRWPEFPAASLVYAARCLLPLVQVPPRGLWRRSGPIAHTLLPGVSAAWTVEDLVARYLVAFGPAAPRDVQVWSGLTGMREVMERMPLVHFRDAEGRELFDVADAPLPADDVPAPPRFLYDFDNVLLSFADRSRVVTEHVARRNYPRHGPVPQFVLVDGRTGGDWAVEVSRDSATLRVRLFERSDTTDVHEEGAALLEFLHPGLHHDVRVTVE